MTRCTSKHIYHKRSSDLWHKNYIRFLSAFVFPITLLSNHHILYIIWKLTISKFILWKPFWNRTLLYHRNSTLKYFCGLLPLSGRCHIPNVLRSYRIKTFYNLDKSHIIGKVWLSGFHIWILSAFHISIFWDRSNNEREMYTFETEENA